MKTLGFGLAAFLLHPLLISAKTYTKNVPVKEIQGKWSVDGNTITWIEDGFKTSVDCDNQAGHKKLCMSSSKKFAGCCLEGQKLLGSPETAFDCCAEGHDLTGSAEAGYRCCPSGEVFDGETCKRKEPTCQNGKVLVNGECVCPPGSKETDDGKCEKQKCSSGLETGKCYTFTGENGERLGFGGSWFIAAPESMSLKSGRFQLCKDEECKAGLPINPSDLTYIRDIHGNPGTGAYPNRWLNNAMNGNHIGKTDNFAQAGKFSMTKWPCGKYCLGGFEYGLGPACPSATPAITFFQNDPQACVPFDFTEVPCDVKAEENNCIWKNSDDQCCGGKVDCPSLKGTS